MGHFKKSKTYLKKKNNISKKKNIISSKSKKYKKRRNTRKIYRKGGMLKNAAMAAVKGTARVGTVLGKTGIEIGKDQAQKEVKKRIDNLSKIKPVVAEKTNLNPWATQTKLQSFNPTSLQPFNPKSLQPFNPNLDPDLDTDLDTDLDPDLEPDLEPDSEPDSDTD
jgi:hypothetical protein